MIPTLFRIPTIDLGLFTIPSFPVGSYMVMMTLGFLSGWWFLRQGYARRGYPLRLATDLVIVAALTGLIGARVLSVLENWDIFMQNPLGVLLGSGGLIWYGGVVLAVPSCIYFAWRDGLSPIRAFDCSAPSMAAGYAFGRLGCHLSGDGCYGQVTNMPWGMAYPNGAVPTLDPVHPTPIFEAIFSFSVAALIGWSDSRRRLKPGSLIALFFILHGLGRFAVEWIRRNPRYWFGEGFMHRIELDEYLAGEFGLSMAQWISIGMMIGGGIALYYFQKRKVDWAGIETESETETETERSDVSAEAESEADPSKPSS